MYRNITISGLPGSGSTTLLNSLRHHLNPQQWQGFSGGEFMRDYAARQGYLDTEGSLIHHDVRAYSPDFDREVDYGMRQRLSEERKWILEAWLAGFMAQRVPGVLKVLLLCSNFEVATDRIVNRDQLSVVQAKVHLEERKAINEQRWRQMYAAEWHEWVVQPGLKAAEDPIDFWDPVLYDLVLDTLHLSRHEVVVKVLDAIEEFDSISHSSTL